jgi:prolyl 4-hydroxylase
MDSWWNSRFISRRMDRFINKLKIEGLVMKTGPHGFLELNKFPNVRRVHVDPPMYIVEDFLSPSECDHIIKISEPKLEKSHVVDRVTGAGVTHPSRTSESTYHGYDLKWLISRVHRLTGVPQNFQEPAQVARYHTGQFYLSHQDALDSPVNNNQRIGTVLIYLNDVKKGGGTYFNTLNVRVHPKKGSAAIFFPAKMNGTIEDRFLHTAEDASDTKWVSQIWLRNKKYAN